MNWKIKDIIDLLNKALALDPEGISKLVHNRVQLNQAILDSDVPFVVSETGELGVLGVLNGIFTDPYNRTRIGATIDPNNPDGCIVTKFVAVPR